MKNKEAEMRVEAKKRGGMKGKKKVLKEIRKERYG